MRTTLLIVLMLMLSGMGCESANSSTDNRQMGGPSAKAHTWTIDSSNVLPLELVVLKDTDAAFENESYLGDLSGAPVTLVKLSSTSLACIIPQNSAGQVLLTIQAGDSRYEPLRLDVGLTPPLQKSTVEYLADEIAAVRAELMAMAASGANIGPTLNAAEANLDRVELLVAGLDAPGLEFTAQLIASNPSVFHPQSAKAFSGLVDVLLQDTARVSGALILATVLMTTGVPLAVAAGVIVGGLALCKYVPILQADVVNVLNEQFPEGDLSVATESQGGSPDVMLVFATGIPAQVTFEGLFGPLDVDDLNNPVAEIARAAQGVVDAGETFAKFGPFADPMYPEIPSLAPPANVVQPADPNLLNIDPTSVSPSAVQLAGATVNGDGLVVTFTAQSDTVFSFGLTYNDGIGPPRTTTFSATISAPCLGCSAKLQDTTVDTNDLCPSSASLFDTLLQCLCSGACAGACSQTNVCLEGAMNPDTTCVNCGVGAGCGAQYTACGTDQ